MADRAGRIEFIRDRQIFGWALDREDPEQPVRVELMIDSTALGTVVAEVVRDDLAAAGIGTGRHGFVLEIPRIFPIARRSVIRARHVGTDAPLERSGEPAARLVTDASIAFEDDQTPWDVLARHDPTWEWKRDGAAATPGPADGPSSAQARRRYLRSGTDLVQRRLATLTRLYGPFRARELALDFGCGSGRLTLPLARRFEHVIAYDISRGMVAYTALSCMQHQIMNVVFCRAPESLPAQLAPGLDLVLALGVLEHVEQADGLQLIAQMLAALKEGGRGCIGLLASNLAAEDGRAVTRRELDFGADGTVIVGSHPYDLNAVGRVLHEGGVHDLHVEAEAAGTQLHWTLYFSKGHRTASR